MEKENPKMFTSKLNTMTGKLDWEILDEDYDYQQELARAGFADMLHDYERNRKYYEGLKKVIAKLKSENKKVNVLDIGTGTGLLSMMAVSCGADTVYACEAFAPMIQVAKRCIEANGMKDKIHIIEKRSTDIEVGVDMPHKANVLVTEVFDTELIGEGAISTFTHALENLLVEDCYVIPDNGIMYVQIVDSASCYDWNWLNLNKYNLKVPEDYVNPSGDAIFDIQLTQFNDFKPITPPLEAFRFSFSGKQPLLFENKNLLKTISINEGKTHGVFMWWILNMDYDNEILLSCAPKWAHHTPNDMQWRDHWMQAIYFPINMLDLKSGDEFYVECNHDEYSLWFDVRKEESESSIPPVRSNLTLVSRNRLSQLNDTNRNDMFVRLLKRYEDETKNVLIANDDFSVISLVAASQLHFNKIYAIESNGIRKKCLQALINENKLQNKISIIDKNLHELERNDLVNLKFDLILSEFSFGNALLPWDNLYFFYGLEHLNQLDSNMVNNNIHILPKSMTLKAIAVQLEDLDKIRSPVGNAEGFNLDEFDKVILNASKSSDGFMEPHPLWEYPSVPLSDVHEVFHIDYDSWNEKTIDLTNKIPILNDGVLNGIAIWSVIEYDKEDTGLHINTGLLEKPQAGKNLVWSTHYKQAVHILDKKYKEKCTVICHVNFNPSLGKFDIDFKIN